MEFRTSFAQNIFQHKYRNPNTPDWKTLSKVMVEEVTMGVVSKEERARMTVTHEQKKWVAGGRYLYYAGHVQNFWNNCYLLRAEEDTREDWAELSWKSERLLMTGGGIGSDYSVYRPYGAPLASTGGTASGPVSAMKKINAIGHEVKQGGSRRSAIYGSLNWQHPDAYNPEIPHGQDVMTAKEWDKMVIPGVYDIYGNPATHGLLKAHNFNHPAPLDITNISLNYDNDFLRQTFGLSPEQIKEVYAAGDTLAPQTLPPTFVKNVEKVMSEGDPAFSFNFFDKENETLRNACTEVTSEDDSDVCNLASVNMAEIDTIEEFREVVYLASRFLLLGTISGTLPYEKVRLVREKNRRLGLGLMGVHEWLLKRGYRYEVVEELHEWLAVYRDESERAANDLADRLGISRPVAYRAIAPTGTIGIMAGTTTGIEPLFAVSYRRRFLKGTEWHYEYVVDGTAKILIDQYGLDPHNIETALDLANDPERRIKFQFDVQKYVDMGISSTINLPSWGSEQNNPDRVEEMAELVARYSPGLRGLTFYADGSRGGQPLTSVPYWEATSKEGETYKEEYTDVCDLTGGGTCGV